MFGLFTFGEGFFGQPEGVSSITGSGSCTQQSQTCSGSGTIPFAEAPAGGGTPRPMRFNQRRKRWEYEPTKTILKAGLAQAPAVCRGQGTVSFTGDGKARQATPAAEAVGYSYRVTYGRRVALDAPDCMPEEDRIAKLLELTTAAADADAAWLEAENTRRIELILEMVDDLPTGCRIHFADK